MKKNLLAGIALAGLLAAAAEAAPRRAAVIVRGGYGYHYGGMGWYDPFWGHYGYGPYFGQPNAGSVKFETRFKEAAVYINGGYAGTVGKLKTLDLRAGEYNIEVRLPGYQAYAERVYVAPGKTIKLYPDLHPADRP
jgi:hypothetical protein